MKVRPDCTLPGHPEVFVIGDLMSLDNLPGLAQVAVQSGRHAAETIVRRIAGDSAENGPSAIATVGRWRRSRACARSPRLAVCVFRVSLPGCFGW